MNKIKLTFLLLLFSLTAFSQTPDSLAFVQLQQTIGRLNAELKKQQSDFSKKLAIVNDSITLLRSEIENGKTTVAALEDNLEVQIVDIQNNADVEFQNIRINISKNTLYWIIAVLAIALFSAVLFIWLRRRQKFDKIDMVERLSKAKSAIEENLIKEFGKLTELMEAQMALIKQQKTNSVNADIDHSLALKVASEINIIERNINLMEVGTKGLKQLARSVEKLKDNLVANGYEIPQLLGKPFNQGMKVIVTGFVPDENLEKGTEIITKILIPQVNYNDIMIQTAQIEVSTGI